jgi:hypothetical protein
MTADTVDRSFAEASFSDTAFDKTGILDRIGSDPRNLSGTVEDAALPGNRLLLASRSMRNAVGGGKTTQSSGAA